MDIEFHWILPDGNFKRILSSVHQFSKIFIRFPQKKKLKLKIKRQYFFIFF